VPSSPGECSEAIISSSVAPFQVGDPPLPLDRKSTTASVESGISREVPFGQKTLTRVVPERHLLERRFRITRSLYLGVVAASEPAAHE